MKNPYPALLILFVGWFAALGWAQDVKDPVPLQSCPGVERLDAKDRFIATLRLDDRRGGALGFEVLPQDGTYFSEPILRGKFNRNGVARVELPRSAAKLEGRRPSIRARLVEPGYQATWGGFRDMRYKPASETGEWNFRLQAKRGGTALVHIVDSHGAPQAAQLDWRQAGDPRSIPLESIHRQSLNETGAYLLHFAEDMRVDLLGIRSIRAGCMAGSLLNVPLRVAGPPQVFQLTMNGDGVARGWARYPNGSSPERLTIQAHWAGPLDNAELLDLCASPLDDWALQAEGLIQRALWLDSEGEFHADGLRPGNWRFEANGQWLRSPQGRSIFSVPGGEEPVPFLTFELPKPPKGIGQVSSYLEKLRSPFDEPVEAVPVDESLGTLQIRAKGKGFGIRGDVDLFVYRTSDGALVDRTVWGIAELEARVAPGQYTVRAVGRSPMRTCGFDPREPRRFGESEMQVEVARGQRTQHVLEIAAGGYLNIHGVGKANANGRLATLQDMAPSPSIRSLYPLSLRSSSFELHLVKDSGRQIPVNWYPVKGDSLRGTEPLWPFNEPHRSECLPTGTFQLIARLPGGRTVQSEVKIESGVTTDVTLFFED
ncbi:MAG: hypothetical protein P1V35_12610 [Planctomycetota bacterium]|nr:hypothetical protein [Planctomycetota bacterium]